VSSWIFGSTEVVRPEDIRSTSFMRKMMVRWDNAPHHPELESFPHHKHLGRRAEVSGELTMEPVLSELEAMIKED
ncbi:MAG: DUF6516 family protein, partial [Thaumarchaeota archaeon]|nr:DUF6516 family protein [Nitrososphaerota archaeon]